MTVDRLTADQNHVFRCVVACALLAALASGAKAIAGQFVYVYTRDKQTKDLKRITNFVADK